MIWNKIYEVTLLRYLTRSQAVARLADRTASRTAYYLVSSDCCYIASPAVFEILRSKRIGVASLTF